MALGFGSRKVDNSTTSEKNVTDASPSPDLDDKKGQYYDPESLDEKGRKKSVIASGVIGDPDSASVTVGKQLELEATNSIKYRTCSWQKVIPSSSSNCSCLLGLCHGFDEYAKI